MFLDIFRIVVNVVLYHAKTPRFKIIGFDPAQSRIKFPNSCF